MSCSRIRRKLPGYLDGGLAVADQVAIREHLELCADCHRELESYWKLATMLARLEPVAPPADLATQIRVRISREVSRRWTERLWSRTVLIFDNILRPIAVPATGGVLAALLVFTFVTHNLLSGNPLPAVRNDLPTKLIQPARLESLAPFPVPGIEDNGQALAGTLLLEATVNARGEVVDYHILSGPDDRAARRQLDQLLLFSRFRPLMSFGRPTSGGRVVLSFSQIHVKG